MLDYLTFFSSPSQIGTLALEGEGDSLDVTEFGAKLVQRCSGRALTVIVKLNEENVVGLDRATAARLGCRTRS